MLSGLNFYSEKRSQTRSFLAILVFLFCLIGAGLGAQIRLSGTVVDQSSRQPIAKVWVVADNDSIQTNEIGLFTVTVKDSIGTLLIEKAGFQTMDAPYNLHRNSLLIVSLAQLSKQELAVNTIQGVDIEVKRKKYKNKKENPAYAILRQLWDHHYKNAFDSFENYKYQKYQKLILSLNNINKNFGDKKIFKGMEFMFQDVDTTATGQKYVPIYINEILSEVYHRNNGVPQEKTVIVAEKASGFDNNQILVQMIQNLYKDFNIYDNTINFFNKGYTSPVSTGGFGVYNYELLTDQVIGGEPCYAIRFLPINPAALAFRGTLYISKKNFAIKKVTLISSRQSDVNFIRGVVADLTFKIVNDHQYLPETSDIRMDLSFLDKKKSAKGAFVDRFTSYNDFEFNNPEITSEIVKKDFPVDPDAYKRSAEYWTSHRPVPLTQQDIQTYANIDKLWKVPRFRRWVTILEALGSGYINAWHAIDFGNFNSTFGANAAEGFRLRVGARTFFTRNDMWRIQGYTAYGFKDHQFKYGGDFRYMFNRVNRFTLGIGGRHDVDQMGVQSISDFGVMGRSLASSSIATHGTNFNLSWLNEEDFSASIEPVKNFEVRLDQQYRHIRSALPDKFSINFIKNGVEHSTLEDSNLSLSLIWHPGAKYSNYGVDRFEQFTLVPTLMVRYTKGLDGFLNGDFNYSKLQLMYQAHVLVGPFGRSDIDLEAGKIFGTVPLSLMLALPGNQSYGFIPGTFGQLNYYEFTTDAYTSLIYEHHFNGWILNKIPLIKKLKWREVALFKAAWGSVSQNNIDINRSSIQYLAPNSHIYYEYGFGIENIGIGNFRPLRLDFNWRGNYLDQPNITKFSVKVGITFGF